MKKTFFLALLVSLNFGKLGYSQNVGIGTATPNASAKLHIVDANRGILIPQVSIGNVALAAPVTAPATGLLVYNTNATTTGGSGTGFYYWTGTQWTRLSTAGAATSDADFYEVGTTTAPDNIADNIYTNGNLAIGNNTPGNHTLMAVNATTPAIKVGQTTFNNIESGRLIFEENSPTYTAVGTYCGFEFQHDGAANLLHLNSGCTAASTLMTFTRGTNRVGILTTAPTAELSVNGDANKVGGGAWAVFSDARLKENISDYKEGLELIKQIRPVNFSYNAKMREIWGENPSLNGRVYQGVIAQDLQKIAPDMVREVNIGSSASPSDADFIETNNSTESYLEVDPSKFTYTLINAVQQQQELIENQDAKISLLETENEQYKAKLDALNKRLARIEQMLLDNE